MRDGRRHQPRLVDRHLRRAIPAAGGANSASNRGPGPHRLGPRSTSPSSRNTTSRRGRRRATTRTGNTTAVVWLPATRGGRGLVADWQRQPDGMGSGSGRPGSRRAACSLPGTTGGSTDLSALPPPLGQFVGVFAFAEDHGRTLVARRVPLDDLRFGLGGERLFQVSPRSGESAVVEPADPENEGAAVHHSFSK